MPSKCTCEISITDCKIHDECVCGKRKCKNAKTCRDCYSEDVVPPEQKVCPICKNKKHPKADHCHRCYLDKKLCDKLHKTLGQSVLSNYTNSIKYNPIRLLSRKLMQRFNLIKECSECDWKHNTEVCHIIPIRDFSDDSYVWEICCPKNMVYLCPNHHAAMDSVLWTPTEKFDNGDEAQEIFDYLMSLNKS